MQIKQIKMQNFSSVGYPLIRNKEEKALFSNFQTDSIVISSENKKKKNILKPILTSAAFFGVGVVYLFGKKKSQAIQKMASIGDDIAQDVKYREKIARAIGLNINETDKISSIVGPVEFFRLIKEMSKTPEVYSPGKPIFAKDNSIEKFLNENVSSGIFGANLHIHTHNSDGKMSVEELLSQAVEYANKRAEKGKPPFLIALTDHDTVEGCKEAVALIAKQPEKYKNLKVVLGCENTFVYANPELLKNDIKVHLLSYAINPYEDKFNSFLQDRIKSHNLDMQSVLERASRRYSNSVNERTRIDFSLGDMKKITPSIVTSLRDTTYYMKDYLQFKIIFSKVISNKRLVQQLNNAGLNVNDIDFSKAIELIPKNPDYSEGQKYYEYYHQSLKKYILELIKQKGVEISPDVSKKMFPDLSAEFQSVLQDIENATLNPSGELYVKPVEYLSFENALTQFSSFEDGILSLAHPTVFYPMDSLKNSQKMPDLYEALHRDYVKFGKHKSRLVENLYQSYYQNSDMQVLEKIRNISAKYDLLSTGGLDTHGDSIFSV